MAQPNSANVPPRSTAGSYEDQKNNGNRKTDEGVGGAEKGGPGLSKAQHRLPPDADQQPNQSTQKQSKED